MGFAEDVKAFREKALKAMSDSVNAVVNDLATDSKGLIEGAPVLKGVLLNSWYSSVGKGNYDMTVTQNVSFDGMGSRTRIAEMLASNPFYGKDNTISLTNSQDYAYKIEYESWSTKNPVNRTPNGWVRIAVQNIKGKLT